MSNFFVSISNYEIATQIADLLNKHNELKVVHDTNSIASGVSNYFVEISHIAQEGSKVVGCIGIKQETPIVSKIFHLCVDPKFRNLGIAYKLINVVAVNSKTEFFYGTIRENNIPSLKLVKKLGFIKVGETWSSKGNYKLIKVGRRTKP
jgi:ribosomal protein S18 acetylase RimI-like enzyme